MTKSRRIGSAVALVAAAGTLMAVCTSTGPESHSEVTRPTAGASPLVRPSDCELPTMVALDGSTAPYERLVRLDLCTLAVSAVGTVERVSSMTMLGDRLVIAVAVPRDRLRELTPSGEPGILPEIGDVPAFTPRTDDRGALLWTTRTDEGNWAIMRWAPGNEVRTIVQARYPITDAVGRCGQVAAIQSIDSDDAAGSDMLVMVTEDGVVERAFEGRHPHTVRGAWGCTVAVTYAQADGTHGTMLVDLGTGSSVNVPRPWRLVGVVAEDTLLLRNELTLAIARHGGDDAWDIDVLGVPDAGPLYEAIVYSR